MNSKNERWNEPGIDHVLNGMDSLYFDHFVDNSEDNFEEILGQILWNVFKNLGKTLGTI